MLPVYEVREHDKYYVNTIRTGEFTYLAHWHEDIELVLFLKGEGQVVIGGERFSVRRGSLCLFNSRDIHSFPSLPGGRLLLMLFSPAIFDIPLFQNSGVYQLGEEEVTQYCTAFEELEQQQLKGKGPWQDLGTLSILTRMLLLLPRGSFQKAGAENTQDSLLNKKILNYMEQRYLQGLTLEGVASHFGFSPAYFSRLFHRNFEISFIKYYTALRLHHACRMLETTDRLVLDIALESGYENLRSFNRAFVKQMGISPVRYRRESRQREQKRTGISKIDGR